MALARMPGSSDAPVLPNRLSPPLVPERRTVGLDACGRTRDVKAEGTAMSVQSKPSKLISGATGDWEVVIGLEVHAQVTSNAKLFSGASTAFGGEPNATSRWSMPRCPACCR